MNSLLLLIATISTSLTYSINHEYPQLTEILKEHVKDKGSSSIVDYKKLKDNSAKLDAVLKTLSAVKKNEFDGFNKKQQQAFLINAYNAFTLKLIIDNYPVSSIKKIGGWFGSPWKKKFFRLLGQKTHLDHIEHGILRKNYKEPRVHFAVNCASIGCPKLMTEAFTAKKLEKQLDAGAKAFLSDESRNKVEKRKLGYIFHVSKIFDWFGEDFKSYDGGLKQFLVDYFPDSALNKSDLKLKHIDLKFKDYDWDLNE